MQCPSRNMRGIKQNTLMIKCMHWETWTLHYYWGGNSADAPNEKGRLSS